MNQISLYNKSTDSKLSIEAEELTRSRNIKIPKDGSFLLTNKTRLTENLLDKYTVGPTGDFQELEEAVRVLCNMKQHGSSYYELGRITVELQEDYVFKGYRQTGMDAGFIKVTAKAPINATFNNLGRYLFAFSMGAIGPLFDGITFNLNLIDNKLMLLYGSSTVYITGCNFNIDYKDNIKYYSQSLFHCRLFSYARMERVVYNFNRNQGIDEHPLGGTINYIELDYGSHSYFLSCIINIRDYSNRSDSTIVRVLLATNNSSIIIKNNGSKIDCSLEHGSPSLIVASLQSSITMDSGAVITADIKNTPTNSYLLEAFEYGDINCQNIKLVNCGTTVPWSYAFSVGRVGRIYIGGYKNNGSNITNITNIPLNTYTKDGFISN